MTYATRKPNRTRFTDAELQYLDGQPRPGASKMSMFVLEGSGQPKLIDQAESVVIRGHAAGLIDDARRDHLLAGIEDRRKQHRRYAA